jgi:hypothetical protein
MKWHHIILPAMVIGLAIGLALEHQRRLTLAVEQRLLEVQRQALDFVAAQNKQLANQVEQASARKPLSPEQLAELLRLRGQVSVLRQQQSGIEKARTENQQMHTVLARYLEVSSGTNSGATPGYLPQGTWTNTGYASPEDALQTTLWAGYNGDVTNFLASATEEARTNMFNGFKGKTPIEASIELADGTYGLNSVQILGRDVLGDDTVALTVAFDGKDGVHIEKMNMKKIAGQWKFGMPSE